MIEIFHILKFQELINENYVNYVFHWGKWNFELTGNSAYTTKILTSGKTLLILAPFNSKC